MGALVVGTREQLEIQTVCKVSEGHLSASEARAVLGVSERTLRRWLRHYEKAGISFVRHGNKGRRPTNKKPDEFKNQIITYVESELFDFNMTHALEKIEVKFNIKIAAETFRRWCHEKGLVKQAHNMRRSRPRYKRPRFSKGGIYASARRQPPSLVRRG